MLQMKIKGCENIQTKCIANKHINDKGAHPLLSILNGVSSWSKLPLSPKLILPIPSTPKHMEKESNMIPLLDKMLGTEVFPIPSPKIP